MFTVVSQCPGRACMWRGCNHYMWKAGERALQRGYLWGLLRSVHNQAASPDGPSTQKIVGDGAKEKVGKLWVSLIRRVT